jgi:hypothetical protein
MIFAFQKFFYTMLGNKDRGMFGATYQEMKSVTRSQDRSSVMSTLNRVLSWHWEPGPNGPFRVKLLIL